VIRRLAVVLLGAAFAGTAYAAATSWALAAPAKPEILAAPGLWSHEPTATFEFRSSADATDFECRLDGGAVLAACTSPATFASLEEGAHTFEVWALDSSRARSEVSEIRWTVDMTAPLLPEDIVAEAASAQGAIVAFAATDNLDPDPELVCPYTSGSTFPLGVTSLSCTATDEAGNADDDDLVITVEDTTPPALAFKPDVTAAQQSAGGARVDYDVPAATDKVDPSPVVSCLPLPGSLFPLGTTPVSCTAVDAAGRTSAPEMFNVIVQVGPTPAEPQIATTVTGLTRLEDARFELTMEPGVTAECRLEGPSGGGRFLPCPADGVQTYTGLADGAYLFTVQVTNSIGNVNQAAYAWVVDRTPPAPVARFAARAAHRRVALSWTRPIDTDYDRVRLWRKRASAGSWRLLTRPARAASYVDRSLVNHVRYRYRIESLDRAGNVSASTALTAWPSPIVSPGYLEVVHSGPLIDWRAVRRATYYNMQVWRNGRKILSTWPSRSRYRLRSSWAYGDRRHRLSEGRLTVYVWAGFGPKAAVRYGPLWGRTAFVVG
jgi:hypothetical protein